MYRLKKINLCDLVVKVLISIKTSNAQEDLRKVIIFEVITPGETINGYNRERGREIEKIIYNMKGCFFEANASLNIFNHELARSEAQQHDQSHKEDFDLKMSLGKDVEREMGQANPRDHESYLAHRDSIDYEVSARFNRHKWKSAIPNQLKNKHIFIFAKSFLHALDGFDRFLRVLSKQPDIPDAIIEAHRNFQKDFPDLREVRNTVQHMEDRSRGLGAYKKGKGFLPIDYKPNKYFYAPEAKTLVLDMLVGTRYGCTMADGHYGEVDVSSESMLLLQKTLHAALNAFEWSGRKQHEPRA